MKVQTVSFLAGAAAAMLLVQESSAVYTHLQVFGQQVTLQNGTVMNRYHVYAMCTDANDYITGVAGSQSLGNNIVQSMNSDGSAPGSVFFNPTGGGALAPTAAAIAINPDVAYDSFGTIGISDAEQGSGSAGSPNQTGLPPGFVTFGNNTQANSFLLCWFTPGPVEQGRAGYLGDGDPLLRVLLAQVTVSSTSHVRGTFVITGVNNTALAGQQAFTVSGQTFNSIPTPGVLPLIGFAAMFRSRRR